jgi:hypothetical protein
LVTTFSPVTLKAVRRCVQSKLEIAQAQIVHKGREYPILQELVIYQAIAGFPLAIMLAKINFFKCLINDWRGKNYFAVLMACNRAPNYQINFSAN